MAMFSFTGDVAVTTPFARKIQSRRLVKTYFLRRGKRVVSRGNAGFANCATSPLLTVKDVRYQPAGLWLFNWLYVMCILYFDSFNAHNSLPCFLFDAFIEILPLKQDSCFIVVAWMNDWWEWMMILKVQTLYYPGFFIYDPIMISYVNYKLRCWRVYLASDSGKMVLQGVSLEMPDRGLVSKCNTCTWIFIWSELLHLVTILAVRSQPSR